MNALFVSLMLSCTPVPSHCAPAPTYVRIAPSCERTNYSPRPAPASDAKVCLAAQTWEVKP